MDLTEKKLDEIIEDIWINHIKRDFLERRILYYEATLVAAFYHYLRKEIDKYPKFRVFLEHQLTVKNTEKETKGHFDLVIVKVENEEDWKKQEHLQKIANTSYLAIFEFKFVWELKDNASIKDFEKLRDVDNKHIKRAYFVCIYKELENYIKVSSKDDWLIDYYRECNAFPKDNTWFFEFKTGEKILKE